MKDKISDSANRRMALCTPSPLPPIFPCRLPLAEFSFTVLQAGSAFLETRIQGSAVRNLESELWILDSDICPNLLRQLLTRAQYNR